MNFNGYLQIIMKNSCWVLSAVVALVLGFLVPATSFAADELSEGAETKKISTPVYQPDFVEFQPAFGKYEYTVSWEGIPAAEASVSVEQEGLHYRIVADARLARRPACRSIFGSCGFSAPPRRRGDRYLERRIDRRFAVRWGTNRSFYPHPHRSSFGFRRAPRGPLFAFYDRIKFNLL